MSDNKSAGRVQGLQDLPEHIARLITSKNAVGVESAMQPVRPETAARNNGRALVQPARGD